MIAEAEPNTSVDTGTIAELSIEATKGIGTGGVSDYASFCPTPRRKAVCFREHGSCEPGMLTAAAASARIGTSGLHQQPIHNDAQHPVLALVVIQQQKGLLTLSCRSRLEAVGDLASY